MGTNRNIMPTHLSCQYTHYSSKKIMLALDMFSDKSYDLIAMKHAMAEIL